LCLPIRCLETDSSIVACMFIFAGTCLPSCCLAINYYGFLATCHNILKSENEHIFYLFPIKFGPGLSPCLPKKIMLSFPCQPLKLIQCKTSLTVLTERERRARIVTRSRLNR
jgi:hypothetical protein